MNEIINNVDNLITKYGNKIKTNRHLILLYWREFDGIKADSRYISTQDFLSKGTPVSDIVNAKIILELLEREGVDK